MGYLTLILALIIVFYPPISKIIKVLFGGFFNGLGKVIFIGLILLGFVMSGPIAWIIGAFLFLTFYGIKHY
ncbi:hypothetical protein GMB50_10505 [Turicibacter sanguinis]|nr:hypothetical protein [Turicibacter sanguinis]MTP47950.1 hypothetical protein [Turicibacter sanguinis]MTP50698.1 hypothetical protein [Turicibacter sanguinis]MTQ07934.1 hypothetical protein [Turicibacter sanguinis]